MKEIYRYKKWLPTVIIGTKILLLVLLIYVLYHQITGRQHINELWGMLQQHLQWENAWLLLLTIALMLVNWGIETLKWQQLLRPLETIPFYRAFKAILCGISLSLFTPNRIGEFGGRVLLLQKASKLQGIALTLLGSMSQLMVNCSIGLIGFALFGIYYATFSPQLVLILTSLIAGVLIGVFWLYYRLHYIPRLAKYLPFFERFKQYVDLLSQFPKSTLSFILLLSMLRYAVYTLQYILLIQFFGVETNWLTAVIMITGIFFIQTIVPSIAIVELGIRGNVALFFWTFVGANTLSILSATFVLWLINLVLPALLGMLVLLSLQLLGKEPMLNEIDLNKEKTKVLTKPLSVVESR